MLSFDLIPSMLFRLTRGLWPPVDPALVDAGREGELAVARTRIGVFTLLAINPAAALIAQPADTTAALALVIDILFIALAITILQLARRSPTVNWLGFAAVALDVTFVSFYHVTVLAGAYQ